MATRRTAFFAKTFTAKTFTAKTFTAKTFTAKTFGAKAFGARRLAGREAALVAYAWDLASDGLVWGPGAEGLAAFDGGAAYARAVETAGGLGRAEAIAATADCPDAGHGTPYACRYALRLPGDSFVAVEDRGRWFADAAGRPAFARGLVRIDAGDTLSAALRARANLLAAIAAEREARGARFAATLVVGRYEPAAGTEVERLPARLRRAMRRRDSLVPYGPDRFAILLPCCPAAEAGGALARIADLLLMEAPALRRLALGAACAPGDADEPADLLRLAEEALAPARRPGLAAERPTLPARPKVGTSAEDVLTALNGRQIDLAFLPALDGTGEEIFATALAVRRAPSGRLAPPGDLAAATAREGLAELLDIRALDLIADRLARQSEERLAWRLAAGTLLSPDLTAAVAARLGARPGIESRLIVEVPEEALAAPATQGRLGALKALGVAVMLGGYGQGHAAGRRLAGLPVDLVRIDPRFVERLSRAPEDRLFLRSLVDRARHLGLVAVADGVATEEEWHLLAAFGADAVMGPAAGPPAARPLPLLRPAAPRQRGAAGAR